MGSFIAVVDMDETCQLPVSALIEVPESGASELEHPTRKNARRRRMCVATVR
jgi:hypothetical protein